MEGTLESLPKISGNVMILVHDTFVSNRLNFLDFFHRLGGKEILWGKRNFGDSKRIFERAVVEALHSTASMTSCCSARVLHARWHTRHAATDRIKVTEQQNTFEC
jgi:hypothetical protein